LDRGIVGPAAPVCNCSTAAPFAGLFVLRGRLRVPLDEFPSLPEELRTRGRTSRVGISASQEFLMSVRTRFAPSPTGYLHIGGVRTALFNWLFTRQRQGQFLLRIDDTDAQRNKAEALEPILSGFRWLGLTWDEGPDVDGPYAPYFQSQRLSRYQAAVEELLRRGCAYRDYATTDEIKAERENAEKEKRVFLYSRSWMAEAPDRIAEFESQGRQAVVRLKMPRDGECCFHDHVRGDVASAWAQEQDHVIQRNDGTCLYHLASAVDDYDFRITHVIRSEEHLSNTPRQIFIMNSLGYPLPEFAHLPYVAEPGSKNKLSKRKIAQYLKNAEFKKLYDHGQSIMSALGQATSAETFNPVIVDFYEQTGYLPEAIVNYLLLLGWSYDDRREDFTIEEMIREFSLERVNRAPASFDPQKLLAFQDRYFRALPVKKKVKMVLPYLQRAGLVSAPPACEIGPYLAQVIEAAGDRIKVAGDILAFADFFRTDEQLQYDEREFAKVFADDSPRELIARFAAELADVEPFTAARLEELLKQFATAKERKVGQVVQPVRLAVTGKSVGLGLYETMEILGRDRTLRRMRLSLARAAGQSANKEVNS
jgi:glutamyl-tRNA synthetase